MSRIQHPHDRIHNFVDPAHMNTMEDNVKETFGPTGTWECKIGSVDRILPNGSDAPMRQAVARAYKELTGEDADFIFSGWSAELTPHEKEVVEELSSP